MSSKMSVVMQVLDKALNEHIEQIQNDSFQAGVKRGRQDERWETRANIAALEMDRRRLNELLESNGTLHTELQTLREENRRLRSRIQEFDNAISAMLY